MLMRILFENSIFLGFEDAQKGMLIREDHDLWQTGEVVSDFSGLSKISSAEAPTPEAIGPGREVLVINI